MKKITSVLVLLATLPALSICGQDAKSEKGQPAPQSVKGKGEDAKVGPVLLDSQSVTKGKEEKKPAGLPSATSTNEILGKRVVYGGYFTDLRKAEKKRALFDLSTPINPEKDLENFSFYPGTEKVQGQKIYTSPVVILFSIKH